MNRNWDFKPSRLIMNARDYNDLVVYSLMEEGWSHSAASKEADRRIEVMSKTQDEHRQEAVDAFRNLDFTPGAKTFAGALLRGAFEGTFPIGCPDYLEEFYAQEDRPEPLVRAYRLGLSSRDGGMSPDERAEWDTLQEAHP